MIGDRKSWFAIDVIVAPEGVLAVETAFDVLDALGTETSSLHKKPGDDLTVTGFFDKPIDPVVVSKFAQNTLINFDIDVEAIRSITPRIVKEEDWLAEWKKHWQPTEIGKFVIAPPWSDVESDKIVIRIEPNMAFGTGTHETTQLCLKALSENYLPEMSMLDVGTGTGILAIAAAKLGGTNIFACDVDADSVAIARENAVLNEVGGQIKFADKTIDGHMPQFDFVCANLTLDVIQPILGLLLNKSKSMLLLSGILAEQESAIRGELSRFQISNLKVEMSGEWMSVLIKRA